MAGRFEIGILAVAELAAVGWIDLAVAHQAIGHLWQRGARRLFRYLQAAMAGFTGILRVQLSAETARQLR